jgi:hypothetical protein
MRVGALVRRAVSTVRATWRRWDDASRRNASERTLYRGSDRRSYPSREAAQPRHQQDGGFDASGGSDGG